MYQSFRSDYRKLIYILVSHNGGCVEYLILGCDSVNSGRRYLLLCSGFLRGCHSCLKIEFLNKMFLKIIFCPQIKGTRKIDKFVMRSFIICLENNYIAVHRRSGRTYRKYVTWFLSTLVTSLRVRKLYWHIENAAAVLLAICMCVAGVVRR